MTQLERTRASVVMNINESHYSAIPWDKEGEGSRGVSGGPAQGGDVGATMETQCPVEDRRADTAACLRCVRSSFRHQDNYERRIMLHSAALRAA